MVFFLLSPLLNENNSLESHLSNFKVNYGCNFFNNKFQLRTCKMTCVIQGILPSHHFRSVNLCNYDFHMCLKVLHLLCAFTSTMMK
jgi:hypothetical protein